jgi:hypothetical protein
MNTGSDRPAAAGLRAMAILIAALLFAYVHSNTTIKTLIDDYRNDRELVLIDVGWLQSAMSLVVAGKSPYSSENIATLPAKTGLPDVLVYPPIMLAPLLPLGLLTLSQATVVVGVANFAALVLIFVLLAKHFVLPLKAPLETMFAMAVLFGFASFVQAYKSGNPLLFSIALVLLAWALIFDGKSRLLIGVLLGAATLFKPHFGFLFLPFLLKRQYAVLAGGAACFAAALILVHCFLPLSVWFDFFGRVGKSAVVGDAGLSYASINLAWNQSLQGVFGKLFAMTVPMRLLIYAVCLAVLAGTVIAVWRRRDQADRDYFGFSFSILLVASFLVMPVSWVGYFSFLALPALWQWMELSERPGSVILTGFYMCLFAAFALPFPHLLSVYQTWWIYMWPVLLPLSLWLVLLLRSRQPVTSQG